MSLLKSYYHLAKPGIVYGNLLSVLAGFFLAAKGFSHMRVFFFVVFGISFVIASGCVFNNYIDRNVDKKMKRTSSRELVTGLIPASHALIYATLLGIIGFLLLIIGTNMLTVLLGIIGFVVYVAIYGYAKRHTIYNTVIGSISGSMPLVAGYTALSNRLDTAAILLFIIMTYWQMPHFYAISIRRLTDYTEAGLIIWPVKKGVQSTKLQILYYTIAFVIASLLLFFFGYKGYIYLFVSLAAGIYWLWIAIQGFHAKDDTKWAKKMFFSSLLILLLTCVLIGAPRI